MIGIAMAIFVILIILLIVYFNLRAQKARSKEDKQVEKLQLEKAKNIEAKEYKQVEEKDGGEELWKEFLYADKLDRTEFLEMWHEEYAKIVRAELAERRKESLNNLEEEEQADFAKIAISKLGRRIAELKEETKQEATQELQQGAEEEQNGGPTRRGGIVKLVWCLILTAGIIYIIVAMVAGWLRIAYGIIILFILFGCFKAMR